jgi:hypothetical protein
VTGRVLPVALAEQRAIKGTLSVTSEFPMSRLEKAESLGGKRLMGSEIKPDGRLVVGQFSDSEGNLIGVAGPK